MNSYYPHLFESFTVKGVTFRNRIFSAPNMMCQMDEKGFPTIMIGKRMVVPKHKLIEWIDMNVGT